jgi:hypothetical protein
MKIKCPICNEKDFYNLGSDDRHKIRYHEIREKIHEKIESLENRMNEIDRDRGHYDETQYQKYHEYQYELKSLLEDKK